MGLFDFNSKPRVTADEFHRKVEVDLSSHGFHERQIEQLKGFLRGDLKDGSSADRGISANEVNDAVTWLRGHKHEHMFSDHQIDTIDHVLRKHL